MVLKKGLTRGRVADKLFVWESTPCRLPDSGGAGIGKIGQGSGRPPMRSTIQDSLAPSRQGRQASDGPGGVYLPTGLLPRCPAAPLPCCLAPLLPSPSPFRLSAFRLSAFDAVSLCPHRLCAPASASQRNLQNPWPLLEGWCEDRVEVPARPDGAGRHHGWNEAGTASSRRQPRARPRVVLE